MQPINLDIDVLRSFVAGIDLGSYARAAERVGRSTSAVSAQLRKLEEQAGTAIFRKAGRGLALTDAGETMLAYARRLLALNDEAVSAARGVDLEGWVRIGLQEDFGETVLPEVLGRFARAHPKVRIEARIARNSELVERVRDGRLDLSLAWSAGERTAHCDALAEVPLRWIGPASGEDPWKPGDEPLPLVALEAPCLLRDAAARALERAGISWRLAFTSPSLTGSWAATAAGLGVTIRTEVGLPASLRALPPGSGLPSLPRLGLLLHRAVAEPAPAIHRLADIVADSVRRHVSPSAAEAVAA